MRTSIPFALVMLALGCGEESKSRRPSPEPARPTPARAAPAPTAEPPASEPVAEPPPSVGPPVVPEPPIPTSPPLPTPPSDPTRAHVFAVSRRDDEDFGDHDELGEEDARRSARLFVPEAALRPAYREQMSVPNPYDRQEELEMGFPQFRYPDARVGRLVNERVRSFARAVGTGDAEVWCEGIATLQLVSIRCSRGETSEASPAAAETTGYAALTLEIEGGEVRPMPLADAFVPGTDLSSILARGCDRCAREESTLFADYVDCRNPGIVERAAFGRDGVEVNLVAWDPGQVEIDCPIVVPYDDLANDLLASGPLAGALYRRRARTREIQIDPSRRAPTPPSSTMWAVGPMFSPAEAAQHWLRLPAAQRDAVRLVDGYLTAPSPDAARAAATVLGFSARQVSVSTAAAPLALRALQLTRDSPMRVDARRAAPVARALLRGTFIAAAGDAVEGYVRAFAAADADGYVDVGATGPADACMPDVAPVLASLPEDARAGAAAATLRVFTRQAGRGRAIFATELGERIHVEIRRVSDACVADEVIARFDRPGARLAYLGLTHSERGTGAALVVTLDDGGPPPADDGAHDPPDARAVGLPWSPPLRQGRDAHDPGAPAQVAVFAYDGGRPIFSGPLGRGERVANGRNEGDVWYPITVLDADGRPAGGFTWTGQTLARTAPN